MKLTKQFQLYRSEMTRLIDQMRTNNPKLEESQRAGRALLWDKKPIELDQQARDRESGVKQQAYVYQNKLQD